MALADAITMEPLAPRLTGELQDRATDVIRESAALSGLLCPRTLASIVEMMRLTNSYYSNRIEGNNTHPVEIQKALWRLESRKTDANALRKQSAIHVRIQAEMLPHLASKPVSYITSFEFLSWLHRAFYERMPDELCWVTNDETGAKEKIIPGEMRQRLVKVGVHIPPAAKHLPAFLQRFNTFYDLNKKHGIEGLMLAGAAHHRLAWIHPFLDGNGRVARLFTDAYLVASGVNGYGLWNVSRGLARDVEQYRSLLAAADSPRLGDVDGRGNLSLKNLERFSQYFLDVCIDQIRFMATSLAIGALSERIESYIRLRTAGALPALTDATNSKLKPEAFYLLREALMRGEFARGEATRITGLGERTARDVLRVLVHEGLLLSDTEKTPVRLGFPVGAAHYWFPNLFPELPRDASWKPDVD